MLERLASACFHHRWRVLALWLAGLVALVVVSGSLAGEYSDEGRLDGTDSQAAYDLLERELPERSEDTAAVVFHAADGLDAEPARTAIAGYLDDLAALPGVAEVEFSAERVSPDGTIGFASVDLARDGPDEATATAMEERAAALDAAGVRTEFSGWMFEDFEMPASEVIGLLAAMVILLIAFGSVVAMGLPITTAIVGVIVSGLGVGLWATVVETPEFVGPVAAMIGLGVGIDYALFIVTRYRAALHRGLTPEAATREAMATAGRAVVFAGGTVMISLLGLLLMGLPFLYGLAFATSTAVLIAVIAAVTLLPALLGFVRHRIDRFSVHRRRRRDTHETLAHRWSRSVQRRPVVAAVGGTLALLALAAPVLSMRLAVADDGNDREGTTTREAYDLLADGFGPGVNGPLVLVLETPTAEAAAAVPDVAAAVAATEGVVFATPPEASPSGAISVIQVFPETAPQSSDTQELVRHLREDVLPAASAGDGITAHVGGQTASDIDFSTELSERLPWFIGAVLVCSFLLLLVVFRSLLVPLKAVVMNLLSIGAAYGVMVAVFQWGWLGDVFGVSGAPIEPWAPMMLFAIVFGLSMDYEVFLLSSVREEYDRTHDNSRAVVEGLASTARVITAAAAIMVCVFGSFVVADDRALKLMGLGLAVAVLVDATLVRLVLVPATMELLGDRNWWLPRWLDRVLPRWQVERQPAVVGTPLPPPLPSERRDLDHDSLTSAGRR
jgi:putative drug exporter of the RND superfamily